MADDKKPMVQQNPEELVRLTMPSWQSTLAIALAVKEEQLDPQRLEEFRVRVAAFRTVVETTQARELQALGSEAVLGAFNAACRLQEELYKDLYRIQHPRSPDLRPHGSYPLSDWQGVFQQVMPLSRLTAYSFYRQAVEKTPNAGPLASFDQFNRMFALRNFRVVFSQYENTEDHPDGAVYVYAIYNGNSGDYMLLKALETKFKGTYEEKRGGLKWSEAPEYPALR